MSRHLNDRQIGAIEKVGDILLPGDGKLPAFAQSRCVQSIDRILDYMGEQDLSDLKMLLTLFAYLPSFFIGIILRFLEWSPLVPTFLGGGVLRLMRIGLRGLVFTLYYGDPKIHQVIDYKVRVYTDDIKNSGSKKAVPQSSVGFGSSNQTFL